MSNTTKIVLIIIATLAFTGCNWFKYELEPIIQHNIPQEFKYYTVFKEGTWWVYQDSASGELDTFRITRYGTVFLDYDVDNHEYEFFGYDIIFKDTFAIFQTIPFIDENPNSFLFYYRTPTGIDFPLLVWSPEYDSSGVFGYEPYQIMSEYNGFSQVIKSKTTCDVPGSNLYLYKHRNPFDVTWFARNIGVIIYQFADGRILNLLDYNIVK